VIGHADAETLAAFRAELLSRRKAGRVSAHLAACPRCAALDAQLAEVTAMLTRSTAPPMPDALTARIAAALAAEAAARPGAAPAPAGPVSVDAVPAAVAGGQGAAGAGVGERNGARGAAGGRRPPRPGPGRSWLALRVAAVTAAVAVIAGGGYGVAQLLSSGSPAATGTSSGAASGTGGAPAVLPNSAKPRMSVGFRSGSSARNVMAPAHAISSGTDYRPGQLGAQASAVLAGPNAHSTTQPGPTTAAPQSRPAQFPGLQFCLDHVTHGQRPLLVDVASYQGHPAVIIVLPAASHARPRVLVVAPGCTPTTAHVLATTTLPATP
jgi:hypothetical protein